MLRRPDHRHACVPRHALLNELKVERRRIIDL